MIVTVNPSDLAPIKAAAIPWLNRLLASPTLSGVDLPTNIKGYIYIDNNPVVIMQGSWQLSEGTLYLARSSSNVDKLLRLSILTVVANMTGAIDDKDVVEKIVGRVSAIIADSVKSIYSGFVKATQQPSRLAVDQVNAQVGS
jgi:hypothetical protein